MLLSPKRASVYPRTCSARSVSRTTSNPQLPSRAGGEVRYHRPFLSERMQPSDQILFVGAGTDLSVQLSATGYGTVNTTFMTVIDSDVAKISAWKRCHATTPPRRHT